MERVYTDGGLQFHRAFPEHEGSGPAGGASAQATSAPFVRGPCDHSATPLMQHLMPIQASYERQPASSSSLAEGLFRISGVVRAARSGQEDLYREVVEGRLEIARLRSEIRSLRGAREDQGGLRRELACRRREVARLRSELDKMNGIQEELLQAIRAEQKESERLRSALYWTEATSEKRLRRLVAKESDNVRLSDMVQNLEKRLRLRCFGEIVSRGREIAQLKESKQKWKNRYEQTARLHSLSRVRAEDSISQLRGRLQAADHEACKLKARVAELEGKLQPIVAQRDSSPSPRVDRRPPKKRLASLARRQKGKQKEDANEEVRPPKKRKTTHGSQGSQAGAPSAADLLAKTLGSG